MSEQHKALVRRLMEEVWGLGDLGVVDHLVASEYVGHSSAMDTQTRGTEGYKRFFAALRSAFPDFRVTIEDQIAEGDRVVSRWTARATHVGEYAGIPPSGKQGVMTGTQPLPHRRWQGRGVLDEPGRPGSAAATRRAPRVGWSPVTGADRRASGGAEASGRQGPLAGLTGAPPVACGPCPPEP